jgi:hypothetical protein
MRESNDEILLVLINMGQDPIQDYGLTLSKGSLSGEYLAVPLFGAQFLDKKDTLTAPVISGEGGFENYLPLPADVALPANASLVIQLQPDK